MMDTHLERLKEPRSPLMPASTPPSIAAVSPSVDGNASVSPAAPPSPPPPPASGLPPGPQAPFAASRPPPTPGGVPLWSLLHYWRRRVDLRAGSHSASPKKVESVYLLNNYVRTFLVLAQLRSEGLQENSEDPEENDHVGRPLLSSASHSKADGLGRGHIKYSQRLKTACTANFAADVEPVHSRSCLVQAWHFHAETQ